MAINTANTTEGKVDPIEVDINTAGLAEGVEQEIDAKEDWQARACPPPKGRYTLQLTVEDSKFEQMQKRGYSPGDPNGKYYTKQIVCKIQDPTGKWQDSVVFYKASSGVPKGKKMSNMAGILLMIGAKMPTKINDLKLAKNFYAIIAKNQPILVADCDWSTWDMDGKGEFGNALLVGMDNFPKKADGTYHHIVKTKSGVEVIAKLKLIKWVGKPGVAAPVSSAPAVVAGQKVKTTAPVIVKQEALQEVVMEEDIPVVETNTNGMTFDDDGEVVIE